MKVKAKDLKLADVVRLDEISTFNCAVVKKIDGGFITLWRPYGHISDFSGVWGVICYVGIEEWSISASDKEYEVVERKDLK
jgi:hypothetical protein